MPAPQSHPNTLLVEGRTDQEFVYQLTNHAGIQRGFYIIPDWRDNQGGFETLVNSLPGYLAGSTVKRLGIVVDADDNPSARWRSVVERLHTEGYHLPAAPVRGGVVHTEPDKQIIIGVWLTPDNERPGMLEDLAADLIPDTDPLWPRAKGAVAAIPQSERKFKPTYEIKAQLHTWLACGRH